MTTTTDATLGMWLTTQIGRDDSVGKLARDLIADDGCDRCPRPSLPSSEMIREWTLWDLIEDMQAHGGDWTAMQALEAACAEWGRTPGG